MVIVALPCGAIQSARKQTSVLNLPGYSSTNERKLLEQHQRGGTVQQRARPQQRPEEASEPAEWFAPHVGLQRPRWIPTRQYRLVDHAASNGYATQRHSAGSVRTIIGLRTATLPPAERP